MSKILRQVEFLKVMATVRLCFIKLPIKNNKSFKLVNINKKYSRKKERKNEL